LLLVFLPSAFASGFFAIGFFVSGFFAFAFCLWLFLLFAFCFWFLCLCFRLLALRRQFSLTLLVLERWLDDHGLGFFRRFWL
jgi:hypothetical protein